jgi:serine/threonine protein kinase
MSIETKLNLVFMIVQALRYLKNYEIVHLDCKPANIFVIKNQLIKLIDFG